jgi:hypothetical protein
MADDHHDAERAEYDPTAPTAPEREPPLRSTAPQSEFTSGQVVVGALVALVGLAVTFGLPFVLA